MLPFVTIEYGYREEDGSNAIQQLTVSAENVDAELAKELEWTEEQETLIARHWQIPDQTMNFLRFKDGYRNISSCVFNLKMDGQTGACTVINPRTGLPLPFYQANS